MHPLVQEELSLLERVSRYLQENPYEVAASEQPIIDDLLRLRAEMPEAKDEDKGSLMDQYNSRLALLEQLREARDKPQVDPSIPYFAHLRLKEGKRERDLCLGKATRIDRGIRIVDWRNAPISRIFYQYQEGEEYEEEMGEQVLEGQVLARRTVTIHNGTLQRIDAPEGTFMLHDDGSWDLTARPAPRLAGGQGAALRYHSGGSAHGRRMGTDLAGHRRRSDKRLPDIAGLIDPDQFSLITREDSGFVVIRGTAGSGKTTVALHRIAYLAFEDPTVNSERTLFLVFSAALRDYVSHVLPALGVGRVQVTTFGEWARKLRHRHFPQLPRRVREDTPGIVSRLKSHPLILRALEAHIEATPGRSNGDQALDDWASALTHRALLGRLVEEEFPGSFTDGELDRVTLWCRNRHEELLSFFDDDDEARPELDEEDDALLLRAWQLRVGFLRGRGRQPLRYRHIAIDEVQDFTPLEVRVLLGCTDKRQSITLAGDTQQHVMQDAGFTSWADFFRHLGVEGTAVDTLKVSYRCSRQVVTFALDLLGDLLEDDPPLVTREGPPVEFFHFTDHGACVAFLADALHELTRVEPMASIAVLTPSPGATRLYYDGLSQSQVPNLSRVDGHNFTFSPGVEVTEVAKVKGLEFDYIILVDVGPRSYPGTNAARRLLHVGATRAVHQLWLTNVGDPSPIVTEALAAAEARES
ncbi:MAG: ATP-binding domain-containing protein [Myxococcota bacterium]